MKNKDLKKRILEISYKLRLSHIGSCLTAVDIIDEIFSKKKEGERFVLSSGHAGLALYVVLEKYERKNAEEIFAHHGVHPDRCSDCGIDCSSGSLGQGLPIALGMAMADRGKNVYTLVSDGECAEGSIWESLSVADKYQVDNLKIYLNYNGWSAYDPVYENCLISKLTGFHFPVNFVRTNTEDYPFLVGQDSHYYLMSNDDMRYVGTASQFV